MKLDEFEKLAALCQKYGVKQVSIDGVTAVFGMDPQKPEIVPPAPKKPKRKKPTGSDYERFLYAATEGYELEDDEEPGFPMVPPPRIEVKQ